MKVFIVLPLLVGVTMAQSSGYVRGPVGYPGLANRFKDDSSTSVPANLNNRLGENTPVTTLRIPVDARNDAALVERLNQWDPEHRPFWLLNVDHIEAQRNTGQGQSAQESQQTNLQGRIGEPVGPGRGGFRNPSDTQTIRPIQTRGSFAGSGL